MKQDLVYLYNHSRLYIQKLGSLHEQICRMYLARIFSTQWFQSIARKKKHMKYGPIVADTLVPSKKKKMKITATAVLKFSSQLPIRSFFTGTNGSSVADHRIFTGGWLWECQCGLPGTALTKDFGGRREHLGATLWPCGRECSVVQKAPVRFSVFGGFLLMKNRQQIQILKVDRTHGVILELPSTRDNERHKCT